MKITRPPSEGPMHTLLHSVPPTLQQTATTHASAETPGHSPESLGQSLVRVPAPFSWVLVHTRFCLCPPRAYFPVLGKFWQLCGGVNGDLVQEGLCHTQVCCTQSPWPCGSPLRTRASTGDAQTQFSVSVGSLGPGARKICLSPLSVSGRNGV